MDKADREKSDDHEEKLNFTAEPDVTIKEEVDLRSFSTESVAPQESSGTCYVIFLLYGIGLLLPWNVILSCLDFLMHEVSDDKDLILLRCRTRAHRRFIHLLSMACFCYRRSG